MGIVKNVTDQAGNQVEALEVAPYALNDIKEVCQSICGGHCQIGVESVIFPGSKATCEAVVLERVEEISVLSEP